MCNAKCRASVLLMLFYGRINIISLMTHIYYWSASFRALVLSVLAHFHGRLRHL